MLRNATDIIFVILLPVLLISSTLRYTINEPSIYTSGFDKYNVAEATGISRDDLDEVAKSLITYFNSGEEHFQIRVGIEGEKRGLFNEREVAHLADVKWLIQLVNKVQELSALYIVSYLIIGLVWIRGGMWAVIAGPVAVGSLATLLLLAVVGLIVLVGFDSLFLWFHQISFSNLLWILDPNTDYLIRLFPQDFFFDTMLLVAGAAAVEAALLGGLAAAYLFLVRR
jgi:integral membrane protein (TIGR01906 family)